MPSYGRFFTRGNHRFNGHSKRLLDRIAAMVTRGVVVLLLLCLLATGQALPQHKHTKNTSEARSANSDVAPDLKQRLAKFRQVPMPFHDEGLSSREKEMVQKLVDACRYLDDIYWRQVDPDALTLYASLEGSTNPQDVELRRFLWINGSRFDLVDADKPFVGDSPKVPG